jgi:oligosaccharyl transferase (archaeosortase A-associated)
LPFKLKFSSGWVIALLLILFFALALFMRIYFTYDQVFVNDWVKYTGNDAYFQMRVVDNMANNFPNLTAWDPYIIYPNGANYGGIHFFSSLLAFFVWLFTGGSPTPHAIDLISVFYPVVLGGLTVIPVYFIGKALFNRWAGVIAAGVFSIMPGEYLSRSVLGNADQHVAETLFITVAAMFTIYAIKSARQNQLSWEHIVKRDWKAIIKPLIYSLLAGVFLGIYLITWAGALLFVFIFVIYLILQSIIGHLKGQSGFHLGFTGFLIGLVSLLIFLPTPGYDSHKAALVVAAVLPLVLAALSGFMAKRKLQTYFYPALLAVIGAVFIIAFKFISPTIFDTMMSQFAAVFNPSGASGATTSEMAPFLSPFGPFNIAVAWSNLGTSMFLMPWAPIPGFGIIALIALIVLYIKNKAEDKPLLFFFIWTIVILAATLSQRRFQYYLVVNMSLLSAYLGWHFIWWASQRRKRLENPITLAEQYKRSALVGILGGTLLFGLSFLMTGTMYFFIPIFILGLVSVFYGFWAWVRYKNQNDYLVLLAFIFPIGSLILALVRNISVKNAKKMNEPPRKIKLNPWLYAANIVTLILIVFTAIFWPNWGAATAVASAASFAPSDGWEETLHWLKDNTPEPLSEGSYYQLYDVPSNGVYQYPDTVYGVTAWWDYGYWITRTAHRIPNANPSQDPTAIINVANLLLASNQQDERELVKKLGSAYMVIDAETVTSKLWAVLTWAGKERNKYSTIFYYQNETGQAVQVEIYTPEYYKLLAVRLFNFNGQAVNAKPMVITWEEKTTTTGARIHLIIAADEYESYEAAQQYIAENPDKNLYLGGSSPFISPIQLDAVEDYEMVFGSTQTLAATESQTSSTVKVFKYIGPK